MYYIEIKHAFCHAINILLAFLVIKHTPCTIQPAIFKSKSLFDFTLSLFKYPCIALNIIVPGPYQNGNTIFIYRTIPFAVNFLSSAHFISLTYANFEILPTIWTIFYILISWYSGFLRVGLSILSYEYVKCNLVLTREYLHFT